MLQTCRRRVVSLLGWNLFPKVAISVHQSRSHNTTTSSTTSRDPLTVDDFQSVHGNDPKLRREVGELLQLFHYKLYHQIGGDDSSLECLVPSTLTECDMRLLIREREQDPSKDMTAVLHHLAVMERRRRRLEGEDRAHKQYRKQRFQELAHQSKGIWADEAERELRYAMWHNALFGKILPQTLNEYQQRKLFSTNLFGPKLVFDLSFDEHMADHVASKLAQELSTVMRGNRRAVDTYTTVMPFDIHLTNCARAPKTMTALERIFNGQAGLLRAPITLHPECYLDLYSDRKDQLIYLLNPGQPQAESVRVISPDDIIVVPGIRGHHRTQHTFNWSKAQKAGVRLACLPLDEHVLWKIGTKNLRLEHTRAILHSVMDGSKSWKAAFTDHLSTWVKTEEEAEADMAYRRAKVRRDRRQPWIRVSEENQVDEHSTLEASLEQRINQTYEQLKAQVTRRHRNYSSEIYNVKDDSGAMRNASFETSPQQQRWKKNKDDNSSRFNNKKKIV